MFDHEEAREQNKEPGRDVTPRLFRKWQKAKRGASIAEDMTNPVWLWLFRGRIDPYHANEKFKSRLKNMLGGVDFPSEPRWAGCRMGRSRTELSDGRVFWIAGEHEDYYDADFFIYNDMIVEHENGDTRIYGYPESSFRPTDFHSATAINNEQTILLIGSIGYSDRREFGRTQIYALDTETFSIEEIAAIGNAPGWISKHQAQLNSQGSEIVVSGGEVLTEGGVLESIDDWSLSLSDFRWTRLTMRKWTRFQVSRVDQGGLHLWNYIMRKFALEHPGAGFGREEDLASKTGAEPNMEAYESLYTPSVPHTAIAGTSEENDDLRTKKITIEDVLVRYTDDMAHITVTVEGTLPKNVVQSLADDLQAKLTIVENSECQVKWVD